MSTAGRAVEALAELVRALDGVPPPCRTDPELWFPAPGEDPGTLAAAVRVCERECPAAVECLALARATGATVGVWGGVLLGRVARDEPGAAA